MPASAPAVPGRRVAIGRLCPDPELFTPIVALEDGQWLTDRAFLSGQIARGMMTELRVVTWKGRSIFRVAGMTDRGATGGLAGGAPCDDLPDPTECRAVYGACAVALGPVTPFDETHPDMGTACTANGRVVVDVDGDGHPESFPAAELARAPEELDGEPVAADFCGAGAGGAALGGGAAVLAVVDVDGDERRDLLVSTAAGWYLYAARQRSTHLVRVWGPVSPS
jgi:hypothetical protein